MDCQGALSICLAGAAEWPVRGAAMSSTSETKLARPAFGGPGCGLLAGTAMGALAGPPTLRVGRLDRASRWRGAVIVGSLLNWLFLPD